MVLTLDEILQLMESMNRTDIVTLEVGKGDFHLKLQKPLAVVESATLNKTMVTDSVHPPPTGPVVSGSPSVGPEGGGAGDMNDDSVHHIVAPMVGTFYVAPSPGAEPYVREGDEVETTTVVCIVEAMKLMNEIEAEVKGTVVEVLAGDGQLVEYGQPLFLVRKH